MNKRKKKVKCLAQASKKCLIAIFALKKQSILRCVQVVRNFAVVDA